MTMATIDEHDEETRMRRFEVHDQRE